jgi:hypothetical protein
MSVTSARLAVRRPTRVEVFIITTVVGVLGMTSFIAGGIAGYHPMVNHVLLVLPPALGALAWRGYADRMRPIPQARGVAIRGFWASFSWPLGIIVPLYSYLAIEWLWSRSVDLSRLDDSQAEIIVLLLLGPSLLLGVVVAAIVCWNLSQQVAMRLTVTHAIAEASEPPNNELQRTRPAQATGPRR